VDCAVGRLVVIGQRGQVRRLAGGGGDRGPQDAFLAFVVGAANVTASW
jgi:hypothetical protein